MAVDVLEGMEHSAIHDAEAILYILVWIACLQGGPFPQPRSDGFDPTKSFLRQWCPPWRLDEDQLESIGDLKLRHMRCRTPFRKVLESMDVYFKRLQPYIRWLRKLFFLDQPNKEVTYLPSENIDDPRKNVEHNAEAMAVPDAEQGEESEEEAIVNIRPLSEVIEELKTKTLLYRDKIAEIEARAAARKSSVPTKPAETFLRPQTDPTQPAPDTTASGPTPSLISSEEIANQKANDTKPEALSWDGTDCKGNAESPPSSIVRKRMREPECSSSDAAPLDAATVKRSRISYDQRQQEASASESTVPEPTSCVLQTSS